MLCVASDVLRVYNFQDDQCKPVSTCSFQGALPSVLSWNHTNQVIAVGLTGRKIDLVQASNGQVLSSLPFTAEEPIADEIMAVKFSGNSRYLASASGNVVQLWDLKKRGLKTTLSGHANAVTCVSFFADGSISAGDRSGAIRIWDIKADQSSFQEINAVASGSVTCMNLSYAGPCRIAAGYNDGSLCLWDPVTLTQLRRQQVHQLRISALAFSPKNPRLVATSGIDGRLVLVDMGAKTTELSAAVEIGDALTAVSFHEDAIHCAVGTVKGNVFIYDWRNVRKPIATIDATTSPVRDVIFQVPKLSIEASSSIAASTTRRQSTGVTSSSIASTSIPSSPPRTVNTVITAAASPAASLPIPVASVPKPVPASPPRPFVQPSTTVDTTNTVATEIPIRVTEPPTNHITATMSTWQTNRAGSVDKQHYQSVPVIEEKRIHSIPPATVVPSHSSPSEEEKKRATISSSSSPPLWPSDAPADSKKLTVTSLAPSSPTGVKYPFVDASSSSSSARQSNVTVTSTELQEALQVQSNLSMKNVVLKKEEMNVLLLFVSLISHMHALLISCTNRCSAMIYIKNFKWLCVNK